MVSRSLCTAPLTCGRDTWRVIMSLCTAPVMSSVTFPWSDKRGAYISCAGQPRGGLGAGACADPGANRSRCHLLRRRWDVCGGAFPLAARAAVQPVHIVAIRRTGRLRFRGSGGGGGAFPAGCVERCARRRGSSLVIEGGFFHCQSEEGSVDSGAPV